MILKRDFKWYPFIIYHEATITEYTDTLRVQNVFQMGGQDSQDPLRLPSTPALRRYLWPCWSVKLQLLQLLNK